MREGWAAIGFLAAVAGLASVSGTKPSAAQTSRYTQSLWVITIKSSSRPEPRTQRVCMNDMAPPAELWTCAGTVHAPENSLEPGVQTVSCTNRLGKRTRAVTVSNDAHVIRDREVATDVSTGQAGMDSWSESTMTYQGACPVPLKDEQPFVVFNPDGKVFDPFPATTCMVDALKTVDGVTAPKAGYIWDPENGLQPFVRYTYPRRHDHRPTEITFAGKIDLAGDVSKLYFAALMGGLFDPADAAPDTFGAEAIVPLWKDSCGVGANVVTV